MKINHVVLPEILPCPICGGQPTRDKKDEWDDWGRWVDRSLYRLICCGIETTWQGEKRYAINQWNNKVRATGGIK